MAAKVKMDLNNPHHQLLVGTMANIVEFDGLSPHELYELLEDIKRETFPALAQVARERKSVQ